MRKHHSCVSPTALRLRHSSEGGATLVIVLAILVLVAILIVGFLTRATSERSASASYSATATTRQLADTAVNLVQAQINDATSYGSNFAWASQPGAIRVYDNKGDLAHVYRLYSAASMGADVTNPTLLSADIPPGDWASSPGLWTDLNAPVLSDNLSGAKQTIFPILDPRDPVDPGTPEAPKVTTKIDGFKVDAAPGATSAQPVPMPARWLYVLQNGQVVAPTGSGNNITIQGAEKNNPIVGRIAFWTDDESSKVNINTAAGNLSLRDNKLLPAPWDLPRFRIYDERQLFSENQPVAGEYQRYPGHPANTDLSRLFSSLNLPNMATVAQASTGTTSDFFKLLPRLNDDNGSKGGTVNTTKNNTQTPVTAKSDRLFSSLGELAFDKDRKKNVLYAGESGDSFTNTRQQLESGKFFLTANSRAPEVTLFGTPRIINWPIDSDYGKDPTPSNTTKLASTFDKVIAFCGSTGTGSDIKQYYFQRHDSTHPTNDYSQITRNRDLYAYLQRLTGRDIPGFGGNFLDRYKVVGERDQILTEMVDYIRSTNVYDHSIADLNAPRFTAKRGNSGFGQVVPLKIGNTQGLGRMYTLSEIGLLVIATADGNGLPASDPNAAFDWRNASNTVANPTLTPGDPTLVNGVLPPLKKRLQAMLLLEFSSPMMGFDQIMPNFKVSITGLENITMAGLALPPPPLPVPQHPFAAIGKRTNDSIGSRLNYVNQSGGVNGFQYLISANKSAYQFISAPFTVDTDSTGQGYLSIGGGTFMIEIEVPDKNGSPNVVQTFRITFPSTITPMPDLIQMGTTSVPVDKWWGFTERNNRVTSFPNSSLNLDDGSVIRIDPSSVRPGVPTAGWNLGSKGGNIPITYYKTASGVKANPLTQPASDVVRSLVTLNGDTRLVMASDTVKGLNTTDSLFVKSAGYDDADYKLVHSFAQAFGPHLVPGADLGGKLVPNANYDKLWVPKVPSNITPGADWDWDNAMTGSVDGAYANKPDEGNIYSSDPNFSPYYNAETQVNNDVGKLTSYFTANRIIPSAAMFGSLPTGVKQGVPWRTLLFRPQKDRPRDATGGPKDYLFLDLFSMPVVEPYAISEPFSTAGKVNMNYQILPYTYITRNSGVRAVLGSELVARVPRNAAGLIPGNTQSYYKAAYGAMPIKGGAQTSPTMARLPLNMSDTDGTLRQFKSKFDSWDIFRSPSEICSVYLVPEGYSWTSDNAADAGWYGNDFAMVGDNVRERPYANIYPRLTTQSNTFTVHYTVQALRNANANPAVWDEKKGAIIGEFRGATTIERFIDPSNNNIPDYATDVTAPSLETFYQWRTLRNQAFSQ